MPKLFDDLSAFQAWFNPVASSKSSAKEQDAVNSMGMTAEENAQLITSLHAILKPFLLRRLKADVEVNLPPKKEYILYAPLTKQQLDLYQNVVAGGAKLREWIVKRYCGIDKLDMKTRKALQDRKDVVQTAIDEIEEDESIAGVVAKRRSRGGKKAVNYEEVEDDDFFAEWEEEEEEEEEKRRQARQSRRNAAAAQEPSPEELGRDFAIKQACKSHFLLSSQPGAEPLATFQSRSSTTCISRTRSCNSAKSAPTHSCSTGQPTRGPMLPSSPTSSSARRVRCSSSTDCSTSCSLESTRSSSSASSRPCWTSSKIGRRSSKDGTCAGSTAARPTRSGRARWIGSIKAERAPMRVGCSC